MPPKADHEEIKRLLEKNAGLIEENNTLLKKMYRWSIAGVILRLVWYMLLIGLPFALYFYILEPYFAALGSDYETFKIGLNELPGLKGIEQVLEGTIEKK